MAGLEQLTAMVLAGGLGTRLRPVVGDRPKILAEVAGRPFLHRILDQLESVGIRRVVLLTGYMADMVRDVCGPRHGRMILEYSPEPAPLGTAGAIRLALSLVDAETTLVLNGDSYCRLDLSAFHADHVASGAEASLALARMEDAGRFGLVSLDESGRVTRFEEKSSRGSGLVNSGVYLIHRRVIVDIAADRQVSLERDIFPALAKAGRLNGFICQGPFLDIGTPESYAQAEGFFAGLDRSASRT